MICIHHNDLDGRCAAAIVGKYFGINGNGEDYHATDYKDAAPLGKVAGEDVIIVDFSYKPDDMMKIVELANSVVWIDPPLVACSALYCFTCLALGARGILVIARMPGYFC